MFEPVSEWVRGRLLRFLGLQGTVIRCKGPALRSCLFARSVQIAPTVELGGWNRIDDCCQLLGLVRLGAYSTLASGVVLHGGRTHGTIEVGRYTQLGPQVTVWALNHNINRISAYNGRLLFDGRMKLQDEELPVTIGDGVWVGGKAVVLAGVGIGHMSVIGAGAVVTKSVPPYSVVVGNPGRVIRLRFTEEVRAALDEWQWWRRSPEELLRHEPLFGLDLETEPGRGLDLIRGAAGQIEPACETISKISS